MKKIFLTLVCILISWFTYANEPAGSSAEFQAALKFMYENWLTKYSNETDYRPRDTLTREQAAKFFSEFAEKVLNTQPDTEKYCYFSDLDWADYTLTESIIKSCKMWLFQWHDWVFEPTNTLTVAQALTVLIRSVNWKQDENFEPWWYIYYELWNNIWVIDYDNVYDLDIPATRYEVWIMLYRMYNYKINEYDVIDGYDDWSNVNDWSNDNDWFDDSIEDNSNATIENEDNQWNWNNMSMWKNCTTKWDLEDWEEFEMYIVWDKIYYHVKANYPEENYSTDSTSIFDGRWLYVNTKTFDWESTETDAFKIDMSQVPKDEWEVVNDEFGVVIITDEQLDLFSCVDEDIDLSIFTVTDSDSYTDITWSITASYDF